MREYLKELRESSDMSQEDVAEEIHLSRGYYSRIENGERQKDLDLSLVLKLSKLFDVSVDYIIAEEEKLKQEKIKEWNVYFAKESTERGNMA